MKIRLKDIAARCKVSPATVSRVFNRCPNVREEVRREIIMTARELGFIPHSAGTKKVLAIVTESYDSIPLCGYMAMAITALTREIFARGYSMELVPKCNVDLLRENLVAGAFALPYNEGMGRSWGENNLPLICINASGYHRNGVYGVGSNEAQGIRLAGEHLVARGHRRFGLLTVGDPENWSNRTRVAGFKTAVTELGLPEIADCCRHAAGDNLYEPLGQLLQTGVTAIIATGEMTGIAAAYALNLFGKRIPGDISLIAFEQAGASRYCLPPQTTLSQDFENISRCALSMMEEILAGKFPARDTLVDYRLIIRDSVAALR